MLAALALAQAPPAHAIRSILSDDTLLAEIGHPFAARFVPVGAHLPKFPVQWSLSPAGCMAASGIVLDANTGRLSGTPLAPPAEYDCEVVAVDTFPRAVTTARKSFALVVDRGERCSAPGIVDGVLPAATIGVPYSFHIAASGRPAPDLAVAGLPAALAFDAAAGNIHGTPDAAATATLTITASNGCGAPAVQTRTLTVDRAATTLSLVALPDVAVFGQPVAATAFASGGPAIPQGAVQLCVRPTGAFCGPPFDSVPPGTPPDRIVPPLSGTLDASGRAQFVLSELTIDTFALSAAYAGDSSHGAATAGPVSELVIKGVLLPSPQVELSAPPQAQSGTAMVVGVAVGPAAAGATPTGEVRLYADADLLASKTLDLAGSAQFQVTAPRAGVLSLRAEYRGDGRFSAAASPDARVIIAQAPATSAIPALSSRALALLVGGVAALGLAALRRRARR
ncbi:MAG: Ig-like domain-containing protein [Casimicrobiaceae bacterium]